MPKFCKLCGHYSFKGHRGGICERLNGLVCGQDPACSFAVDLFVSAPTCDIVADRPDSANRTEVNGQSCPANRPSSSTVNTALDSIASQ